MKDHDLLLLTRKSGVEQFSREHQWRAGQYKEDHIEFAALRFVNGKCVSEFQAGFTFVREITRIKSEYRPDLSRKFYFHVFGLPVPRMSPSVTNNHTDFTVGEITTVFRSRI